MVSEVRAGWQISLEGGLDACKRYDYEQGKSLFNKALEQAHQESAPEHAVGEIFFNLGWCHQALGDVQGAEQKYKQALGIVERCYGPGSEASVKVLNQLVSLCRSSNLMQQADEYEARMRAAQSASTVNAPQVQAQAAQPGVATATPVKPPAPLPPPPASKQGRAGIVMDGIPVASKPTGFVAGSMFKNQDKAQEEAAQQSSRNDTQEAPAGLSASAVSNEEMPASSQNAPVSSEVPRPAKRKLPRSLATTDSGDLEYDEVVSESGIYQGPFIIEDLVHPKERLYGKISGAFGCWIYFLSFVCLVGFIIAPLALLGAFISHGLYLGNLRGRGIRVSNRQFPEVQQLLEQYCTLLKMEVPEVLVVNEDGLLNAFASRVHRKDLIVICSDVLELAYESGEKELAFVVVHELAHVKLGHVKWQWLHIPGYMIPFLGNAYSRAKEYTCDRIARQLVPDGAIYGLVALAAGTKLYRDVNLTALYEQAEKDWGFWTWFSEIQSTHPNLVNRIRAIGIRDAEMRKRMKHRDA